MFIEEINAQDHEEFANHERVVHCHDETTGLRAIIAIHNSNLGPALGGCRMYPYQSDDDALTDVLRLAKGMTYKSALANLPLGGGKSVIIGDPKTERRESLMAAMGAFIEVLNGAYIGAEDSGIGVADIRTMATKTQHVAGMVERILSDGSTADGDPSPSTAYGVYAGIRASVGHRFGNTSLDGVSVAVQGVGNVGRNLTELLVKAGATVHVADAYQGAIDRILNSDIGDKVKVVDNETIHTLPVDVYAPCALGGALNTTTLVELRAPIVAGAANNQLANDGAGQYLFHKGTLYAPDFVINAGGIIDIYHERQGYDHSKVIAHIDRIAQTLDEIYRHSESAQLPTHITAEKLGEARFMGVDIEAVA
jgi:leucine dehydrogenase